MAWVLDPSMSNSVHVATYARISTSDGHLVLFAEIYNPLTFGYFIQHVSHKADEFNIIFV